MKHSISFNMSAVREYLLTVEKDKQEAKDIAESTAKSMCASDASQALSVECFVNQMRRA